MAQLATSHKDPEVASGLAAIAKLDAQLQEANLKVGARAHKHHGAMARPAPPPQHVPPTSRHYHKHCLSVAVSTRCPYKAD